MSRPSRLSGSGGAGARLARGARLAGGPAALLAGGLIAIALTTSGGFTPTATAGDTWSEIGLVLLGGAASAAAVVLGARGRVWGAAAVALFGGLAALTAASIVWSVQPDYSWQDSGQTVAYLAAFAGAAGLARLVPEGWPTLLVGLGAAAAVLSGYALLVKVLPGSLGPSSSLGPGGALGRLQTPFGYWNAIGGLAALGLPPCLWAAVRRRGVVGGLAAPAISVLISVVILSYSRSALLVSVLGLGLWLALVPLRLRAVCVLAVGAAGAGVISAWALSTAALTGDGVPLALRSSAGHTFGLVLLLALAAVTAANRGATAAADRIELPAQLRRRIGAVLVIGVGLVPLGCLVALAASPRGLTGEISHIWDTLTSVNTPVGNTAARIGQLGNSRPLYWSLGIKVGEHALLSGVGGEGYATARHAYATNQAASGHAHSYVIQTFADFGLIGLAVNLALLLAWARAAARPLAPRARWRSLSPSQIAERQGMITLAVVTIAFGVQSAVDWTWFFTGVTVPPLLCAGWLAGRGPLTLPVGRAPERRPLLQRPAAGAAAVGLAALTLSAAWLTWQPLRSAQALSASLQAAARGQTGAAFTHAREAAIIDPVSVTPLIILSSLYSRVGDPAAARSELVRATQRQPGDYNTWLSLGQLDLSRGSPGLALRSLLRALALDPTDPTTIQLVGQARSALGPAPPRS